MRWSPRRPLVAGAAAVLVVAALAIAVAARPRSDPPTGQVTLYGDSLGVEAAPEFVAAMADRTDAEVATRVVPGVAPCDLADEVAADAASIDVAVLSFAGNNASRCAGDGTLRGGALADRYDADLRAMVEVLAAEGARVVLVRQPPAPGLPGGATQQINEVVEDIVTEWAGRDIGRVRQAAAGDLLTDDGGGYAERLPCREGEGPGEGCRDGMVPVRNPDRVHLCPVDLENVRCPVHSSGADRFAGEIARVAALALDPLYGRVR